MLEHFVLLVIITALRYSGPKLEPSMPVLSRSGSWTDTQLCTRPVKELPGFLSVPSELGTLFSES